MAYPAAAIANEFIGLAKQNGTSLTPMQVQKLVYFAHGWNLALTGDPLINERVEAWDYGPVVKSLYRDLRKFGSGKITSQLTEPDWNTLDFSTTVPCIDDGPDEEFNDFTKALVRKIWKIFGQYTAFQLSEMTHVPNSPWSVARGEHDQFISDDLIREYFEKMRPGTIG